MESRPSTLPIQQRAWETRTRLLEAALACLVEEGYAATTTARIQARSEVSRGSLLHQFPSKDDLLIAAVHHLAVARATELVHGAAGPGHAGDIDMAVETLWATLHGPLFSAALELWVAAKHNPDLAQVLATKEHELGQTLRSMIGDLFGAEHAAHPNFGELAQVLLSSMRGVALTYTFEPRDHTRDPHLATWKRLAHNVLD